MPESSVLQLLLEARSCRLVSTPLPALEMSMLLMRIKLRLLPASCGGSKIPVRPGESLAPRSTGSTRSVLQVPTRKATLVKLVALFVGVATVNLASRPDADPKVLVALYRRDRTLGGRPLMLSRVKTLILTQRVNVVRLGKWAFLMSSTKCSERLSVVVHHSL